MLDRLGAARDENGRITGLALSLTPTPHRYEAEGRVLYGWCALDTFIPAVLGHTGRITSPDPISGETIHPIISPERIEHVDPPTARIALVHAGDTSNMRETFSRPGRFFAREETARRWTSRREEIDVVPVAEGYAAARAITEQVRSWTAPN